MGLQFSWIEVNLLGSFLADVRNYRGKFDEIKEKFAINPATIASQSSLNAGGSRWTRDLLRNSLKSFTNWSKVEEQIREIHAFKEGNWPEDRGRFLRSWGWNWCVIEAVSIERNCGFKSPVNWLEFCLKKPTIGPRSRLDRATIEPRSGHDRDLDSLLDVVSRSWRWFRDERAVITVDFGHDRVAIESRSWDSSTKPFRRPIMIR